MIEIALGILLAYFVLRYLDAKYDAVLVILAVYAMPVIMLVILALYYYKESL
jgi:hypothetical protein